jgi:polyphosphate kinase
MKQPRPDLFLNRELSWLEFNARVLEEAQDSKTPLFERLRFYGIFHSNLDEFFMVRVASLLSKERGGDHKKDPAGLTPSEQLEKINARVEELETESHNTFSRRLIPALGRENIRILRPNQLNEAQARYLDTYFDREIYPVLTPIAIEDGRPLPRLQGLMVSLAVLLAPADGEEHEPRLAVLQLPVKIPGLCRLPDGEGIDYCWLRDVMRERLDALFPGFRILEVAAFRFTLDSDLELDEEGWDDYMGMLETGLKKRRIANPVRLEFEERMSAEMRDRMQMCWDVADSAMLPVRRPLDPRPLFVVADLPGYPGLRHPAQPPIVPTVFEPERTIFDIIRDGDVLLHHPYESFEPVVQLLEAAAADPDVLAVKQTLYRVSGPDSPVLQALIRAAEQGKEVTVLVELRARFDEEPNIGWAKKLEEAGAHVLYGISGLKVHSKILLVVRREPEGIRRYLHLGTGNYNERTARLYTDLGLLTSEDDFGSDASAFFNTITGYSEPPTFRRLVMAPTQMRERIIDMIKREADRARSGQVTGIQAKMNSLLDPDIIQALYGASQAGVPIDLNVRGICSLRPGIPELSEGIRVVSIVDRYLEHSRVFLCRNGGNMEVWVSSADWMPRNLDRRVELMFPLIEDEIKNRVARHLEAQFADNQKARQLNPDGTYQRIPAGRSGALRVQEYLYQQTLQEQERVKSVTPVRFTPIEGKS